jgi:hypothetical protein
MVTTGNGPALPDSAPSTNVLSSDDRDGCVAGTMAQDPIIGNACDWQEPFVSHMGSLDGPNS